MWRPIAFLAAVAAAAPAAAQPRADAAELFGAREGVEQIDVSPDGRRIVFTSGDGSLFEPSGQIVFDFREAAELESVPFVGARVDLFATAVDHEVLVGVRHAHLARMDVAEDSAHGGHAATSRSRFPSSCAACGRRSSLREASASSFRRAGC